MPEETPPAKRGPGRPRKTPVPPAEPEAAADEWRTAPAPADDRLGAEVGASAEFVSFPDGREYRCEGGRIVERVS
uniref:hypothetical protein n=1 Tax=Pseudonocardia sp. CA-138482 TaxID=3240023 RepID=UPI003F491F27